MRKLLLCAVALALPGLCVAQMGPGMMGPGMMGGGMMGPGMMGGMGGSPTDLNPVWSPDGQWLAFTQALGGAASTTGGVKGGVQQASAGSGATFVNNLKPLTWTPDGRGLICGLDSPANQTSPYSGFWMVNAADLKDIRLICRARVAMQADYSPDGQRFLLVDERAADLHEVLVGAAGASPKSVYIARDGEKLLQAGWTNDSGFFWVLAEVSTKASVQPGDAIPEDALKAPSAGGMMMGPGMMGGGMMGPGMMGGGMMGPGMMMGGAAVPQTKKVLFRFRADGTAREQVCADAEDIEAAAWCPTQPLVAVVRKVAKAATAGAGMGGMMGPGMMGPGMMGGGGGGMMGPGMMGGGGMMGPGMMGGMMGGGATTYDEYLAVRAPDKDAAETRVADPSVPIRNPQWSKDGRLLCGTSAEQARVFVVAPAGPPILEVAQNFDDTVKGYRAASFSPDGQKLAYSGALDVKEGDSKSIIRGLFVVDLTTGKTVQLTSNKSAAPMGGMMGPGMMGGGMMGPGMMGPGMMGGGAR